MTKKPYSKHAQEIHALVEGASPYRTDFVQFSLSKEQLALIKGIEYGADEINDTLVTLTEQGYSVSYKHYPEEGTWGCFLNPKGENHVHKGWTLAGRGSTPIKAMRQVAWVHFTLFDAVWPKEKRFAREPIDD